MGGGSLFKSIIMLCQQEEKIKLKATATKCSFSLLKEGIQPERPKVQTSER